MINLKPCRFCGDAENIYTRNYIGGGHCLRCQSCGSEGPIAISIQEAIDAWNYSADCYCDGCEFEHERENMPFVCETCKRSWSDHYRRKVVE